MSAHSSIFVLPGGGAGVLVCGLDLMTHLIGIGNGKGEE